MKYEIADLNKNVKEQKEANEKLESSVKEMQEMIK